MSEQHQSSASTLSLSPKQRGGIQAKLGSMTNALSGGAADSTLLKLCEAG